MRNTLFLMAFIIICMMTTETSAHAFNLEESVGPISSFNSPYPNVLSQAIDILPEGTVTINVDDETFYYCNGIFYQFIMIDQKYVVVPPPIGALVFTIPKGYQYMFIDGIAFYVFQGVYYRRELDGFKVIFPPV